MDTNPKPLLTLLDRTGDLLKNPLPEHLTANPQDGDWIYNETLVRERLDHERQKYFGEVMAVNLESVIEHEKSLRERAKTAAQLQEQDHIQYVTLMHDRWEALKAAWPEHLQRQARLAQENDTAQKELVSNGGRAVDTMEFQPVEADELIVGLLVDQVREEMESFTPAQMNALHHIADKDGRTFGKYLLHRFKAEADAWIAAQEKKHIRAQPKRPVGRPPSRPPQKDLTTFQTWPMPDPTALDINPFDFRNGKPAFDTFWRIACEMNPEVDRDDVAGALNARIVVWTQLADEVLARINGGQSQ